MTVDDLGFSLERLTLPHEDPRAYAELFQQWILAYPNPSPIEAGWVAQAVHALMELRRLARVRATLRTQNVRLALLNWERTEQDNVALALNRFNVHPPSALVDLLRGAAGCRWAIATWEELARQLQEDGTWYGEYRLGAIQLQGKSACIEHLYLSEEAYTTWADALACQPNPKQKDIDVILNQRNIPKHLRDRDIPQWPRDPAACRARMQALACRELPRLRALEATLRTQYEEPERAEAEVMALASVSQDERQLLRAQRQHEQSYLQASTALLKVRGQVEAARCAGRGRSETMGSKRQRGDMNPSHSAMVPRGPKPRDERRRWMQTFGRKDGGVGRSAPNVERRPESTR